MHQFRYRLLHLFLLLLSAAFYFKVRRVANIQTFLAEQNAAMSSDGEVELLAQYGQQFRETFSRLNGSAPAILLLNKYALNISLNFLCNLRAFPGAAQRLVFITFDSQSAKVLRQSASDVAGIVHWILPALEERFSAGDGRYQLFQLYRAKLAALLTEHVDAFWMVQADTIWRENLFQLVDVDGSGYADSQLIFDSEGPDGLLRSMAVHFRLPAATSSFDPLYGRVNSFNRWPNSCWTILPQFSYDLMGNGDSIIFEDNNVMTRQCILGNFDIRCAQIPYSVISNWRMPAQSPLFQLDGGGGTGDKFAQMRTQGLLFMDPESIGPAMVDNSSSMMKCLTTDGSKLRKSEGGELRRSVSNPVMATVHLAFELAYARLPGLKQYLLTELFPFYAAYLFI